jgi:hypothetical protein
VSLPEATHDDETRAQMVALADAVAPLWAGEAEITRRYFEETRSVAGDLFWLRAQAFKETRHLRDLPETLQQEYWSSGAIAEHPGGPGAARILEEEMKHYSLLAALISHLTGEPVDVCKLHGLEEDRKLQALRNDYRQSREQASHKEVELAAVTFTEGGGGSMYTVLKELEGDDFDRAIAAAFREIHTDEVIHGPMQIHRIARHAKGARDWDRARDIGVEICRQRLHMRNEMFGRPLAPERIDEIEEGKIEPWPIPIEL